ncbi:MAG TPA: CD1871A family CXXC motif-containing protein [Candidatus Ozemobacteraceae bacterium]|nr:CD1871A family CXXC motif-containing protein [Candidatus Ozemobacteraceae bacterium]
MSEQAKSEEAGDGFIRANGWLALAIGSIALMVLGAWLGEPGKIFEKATAICLQCIGIG